MRRYRPRHERQVRPGARASRQCAMRGQYFSKLIEGLWGSVWHCAHILGAAKSAFAVRMAPADNTSSRAAPWQDSHCTLLSCCVWSRSLKPPSCLKPTLSLFMQLVSLSLLTSSSDVKAWAWRDLFH